MGTTPSQPEPSIPVDIIGMGMSPDDLTAAHRRLIAKADFLAGGRRHLALFEKGALETFEITGDLPALVDWIRSRPGRRIVVLASGDPLYYGIGAYLARTLGREKVRVHPNITSVAAAFARMGEPWQEAAVVSLHGRRREDHLEEAVQGAERVAVFTDPTHSPAWIADFLLRRGIPAFQIGVFERMGSDDEAVSWHSPASIAGRTFGSPNMVVLKKHPQGPAGPCALHLGMPESAYAHDGGMITKTEIRAVSLARLNLMPRQVLWDLGAGSGAVAIEASLLMPGGRIWAVEKNPARVARIRANRTRFGVRNLEVVEALLPDGLEQLPDPDRVFIGGAGRALEATLDKVCGRLPATGVVVVNTVLLDSLNATLACFGSHGLTSDVVQVQVSRSRPLAGSARMEAMNPVWVIRGSRTGDGA